MILGDEQQSKLTKALSETDKRPLFELFGSRDVSYGSALSVQLAPKTIRCILKLMTKAYIESRQRCVFFELFL